MDMYHRARKEHEAQMKREAERQAPSAKPKAPSRKLQAPSNKRNLE
jgi:hypothetical protein